jgi:hypothetical protein
MPTNSNAVIYFESGQSLKTMTTMTDSGNQIKFTSAAQYWSKRSGYEPKIYPNGVVTGGEITPDTEADQVIVGSLTCYLGGVLTTVATDLKIVIRGADTNTCRINSITVNSSGALAVLSGTAGTSLSATRGAAGGPPWIPTGSIEIGQVRLTSTTSAVIDSSEIYQVPGQHLERWDYPLWEEYPLGDVTNTTAYIKFNSALTLTHSDDTGTTKKPKKVFGEVYEPIMVELPKTSDFKAPEQTNSVASKQIYGGTLGTTSASLGQGGFTAYLNDGITDSLIGLKNENLVFKFYQDRAKSPHVICQGILGVARTWGVADSAQAACTISAERSALERS